MIKIIKKLIYFGISAIFLCSCVKEDENIGLDEIDGNRLSFLDTTITFSTKTVKGRNRFETGQDTRLLVGNWQQGDSLSTVCKTYFQLLLNDENNDFGSNIICDSIIMLLDYSYSYGDTNALQNFEVYELSEFFQNNNDSTYYNNDELSIYPINLSTSTVPSITPSLVDTLKLYLDTSFGKKLLDSASSKDNDELIEAFAGLSIQSVSASGRGYVFGFSPTSSNTLVRAYYRSDSESEGDSVTFNLFGRRFNNISSEYGSGVTALQNLQNGAVGDEVDPSSTGDVCHFQSGSLFYTKIELSGLEDFLDSLDQEFSSVFIDDARLVVYANEEIDFDNSERPVGIITLYEDDNIDGDDDNDLILQSSTNDSEGTGVLTSLVGIYDGSTSSNDNLTFSYNLDITGYVKALKNGDKSQFSLLMGTTPTSNLDKNSINSGRVFSENSNNGSKAMQFRLYYSLRNN